MDKSLSTGEGMVTVGELMSSPVVTVLASATLAAAAGLMVEKDVGALVVLVEDGRMGMLTERDFVKSVVSSEVDVRLEKVGDLMSSPLKTVEKSMPVLEASQMMEELKLRRLPILTKDKLVGIVTQTDLSNALRKMTVDEMQRKLDEMKVFDNVAVGRELKMIELKKKIAELEERAKLTEKSG